MVLSRRGDKWRGTFNMGPHLPQTVIVLCPTVLELSWTEKVFKISQQEFGRPELALVWERMCPHVSQ